MDKPTGSEKWWMEERLSLITYLTTSYNRKTSYSEGAAAMILVDTIRLIANEDAEKLEELRSYVEDPLADLREEED